MIYRDIGGSDIQVSIIGLGGHEYLPNGRSRGFNEPVPATEPGFIQEGYGLRDRKRLIELCCERGVNFFDATMDSEKDALGRNLRELPPPHPVYVQTRPEGLVYNRDPFNQKMADYEVLRAEVQRGLGLLRRPRLDFLNIAFMRDALDHDPRYLDKIGLNVARLKEEELIRFASLDTFSGQYTYLRGIEAGCFDSMFINFNVADDSALTEVLPAAQDQGMAVMVRECFIKGELFKMGDEVGLADRGALAQVALKWCLTRQGASVAVVGARDAAQMASNLEILEDLPMRDEDWANIERLKTSPLFQRTAEGKRAGWLGLGQ